MNAFAITALAAMLAATAHATVHTVSNTPGIPAQYTNIQEAHDNANAGDTLLVHTSATSYGTLSVDREITVLGQGYGTQIDYLYLNAGASGSKFIGFRAMYYMYLNQSGDITDILLERIIANDYAISAQGMDGLIIKHSVVPAVHISSSNNVFITNNLVRYYISGSTSPTVLISNNVFNGYSGAALDNIQYAVVSNNIFANTAPSLDGYGVENCAFNNNLSYNTSDDDLPPTGSNPGSGNMVGVDPLFVDVPDNTGNWSYDYHLQAGSPGINAGTDGTDIGIYGGSEPMNADLWLDGVPRLPQVTDFQLLNSSISEGGSINVQVQGAKHD